MPSMRVVEITAVNPDAAFWAEDGTPVPADCLAAAIAYAAGVLSGAVLRGRTSDGAASWPRARTTIQHDEGEAFESAYHPFAAPSATRA